MRTVFIDKTGKYKLVKIAEPEETKPQQPIKSENKIKFNEKYFLVIGLLICLGLFLYRYWGQF